MSMEISLRRIDEVLQGANRFVLTAHLSPDGDCLGSMLSLYYYLISLGKSAKMLLDDDVPKMYQYLPGSELIAKPSGEKIDADLLVVIDASDFERIGKVGNIVKAPVLNIDHHISNLRFADFYYLDSHAAATGEILFEFFQEVKFGINKEVATCLYTAIATDCGFFRYANTTPATMRYASTLIEKGAQPHIISECLEAKPLEDVLALRRVLETLETFGDGAIAAITVYPGIVSEAGSTEGFINYPRNIEGVEIAIMFKVVDDRTVRVSLRSKKADVSKLALSFGGGGHIRAAGCTITGSLDEAKNRILNAAIQQIGEIA